MNTRRAALLQFAGTLMGASSFVWSQTAPGGAFPTRPIRVIAPVPPGVVSDVVPRWIAQRLSDKLGQPIVIENKPGASGAIGIMEALRAPADGYTLVICSQSFVAINPHVYSKLPYDPLKDLAPVACVSVGSYLLVAHPSLPVSTLADLVAYAKRNPEKLDYGTYGAGTGPHLAGEMLKLEAGISMNPVHYKTGPITDVVGRIIPLSIEPANVAGPFITTGRLKVLASTSAKRLPAFPDVPTMSETYAGLEMSPWTGFFAAAATPRPIVEKLANEILAIVRTPEMSNYQLGLGASPLPLGPQEFGALIRKDYAQFKKIIDLKNIRLD